MAVLDRFSLETMVPISVLGIVGAVIFWVATMYVDIGHAKDERVILRGDIELIMKIQRDKNLRLSRMEGKLDFIVTKMPLP